MLSYNILRLQYPSVMACLCWYVIVSCFYFNIVHWKGKTVYNLFLTLLQSAFFCRAGRWGARRRRGWGRWRGKHARRQHREGDPVCRPADRKHAVLRWPWIWGVILWYRPTNLLSVQHQHCVLEFCVQPGRPQSVSNLLCVLSQPHCLQNCY